MNEKIQEWHAVQWINEKLFIFEAIRNHQNDRIYTENKKLASMY